LASTRPVDLAASVENTDEDAEFDG